MGDDTVAKVVKAPGRKGLEAFPVGGDEAARKVTLTRKHACVALQQALLQELIHHCDYSKGTCSLVHCMLRCLPVKVESHRRLDWQGALLMRRPSLWACSRCFLLDTYMLQAMLSRHFWLHAVGVCVWCSAGVACCCAAAI
jgi:hypothetical protein